MATHGTYATKAITLHASAARTATGNGSAVGTGLLHNPITGDIQGFAQEAMIYLDVTAASGTTPTLDVIIQGRTNGSGTWTALPDGTFSRKVTTGQDCIRIAGPLPPEIRARYVIGGTTPSFTFIVDGTIGG